MPDVPVPAVTQANVPVPFVVAVVISGVVAVAPVTTLLTAASHPAAAAVMLAKAGVRPSLVLRRFPAPSTTVYLNEPVPPDTPVVTQLDQLRF